ncbi:dienelactone hydrolase family protein [Zavarzinia sp.]|uniref:dienelactone hydrolase family protein n=1 Tax=Zavarzinia sp. TaxID=2027920 RepID=UPI003566BCE9
MSSKSLTIQAKDGGSFQAYVARPASAAPAPAIVVIQEIFGVNAVMRGVCDWLAGEGYVAICPDLFWRIEPGIDITDQSKAEWDRAFALFSAFDREAGIADIEATRAVAATLPGTTGKVGAVGYCLGGHMAYRTACETAVDAAVGYYGVGINEVLGKAAGLRKPLMLHIAGKDGFVPPEAQAKIREGLGANPLVTLHTYAEQDHAFARIGGAHYDKAAADLANGRTLAFFATHLA